MQHVSGEKWFAPSSSGYRRLIHDTGDGPVRAYAFSQPPNLSIEPMEHCHAESLEIFFLVWGEATCVVEGVEFEMKPSDSVIVEPGEFHYLAAGPEGFSMLCIVAPNLEDAKMKNSDEVLAEFSWRPPDPQEDGFPARPHRPASMVAHSSGTA
jgi:mannose-6-phosphate isomerase-like protein (cupin superfamily)